MKNIYPILTIIFLVVIGFSSCNRCLMLQLQIKKKMFRVIWKEQDMLFSTMMRD
jgi:hypothetical protein